jgi:hypothetical protein
VSVLLCGFFGYLDKGSCLVSFELCFNKSRFIECAV